MRTPSLPTLITGLALATVAIGTAVAESRSTASTTGSATITISESVRVISRTMAKYPAVATSQTVNPAAPVPGRNSFTQAQVRERLTEMGYRDLHNFQLSKNGFWHATGTRNGQSQHVVMDYQGNVTLASEAIKATGK